MNLMTGIVCASILVQPTLPTTSEEIIKEVMTPTRQFIEMQIEEDKRKEELEKQIELAELEKMRILEEEGKKAEFRLKQEELNAKTPQFDYNNLLKESNLSIEEIENALPQNMKNLSSAYFEAEDIYGVNALALMSITRLESGNADSYLAKSHNNLGGIKNGNKGYIYFDSKYECIMYLAKILKNNYLTEGAKYFKGYGFDDVNIMYCEQSNWKYKNIKIIKDMCKDIGGVVYGY